MTLAFLSCDSENLRSRFGCGCGDFDTLNLSTKNQEFVFGTTEKITGTGSVGTLVSHAVCLLEVQFVMVFLFDYMIGRSRSGNRRSIETLMLITMG